MNPITMNDKFKLVFATQNWLTSSVLMFVFWLGTLPGLVGLQLFSFKINRFPRWAEVAVGIVLVVVSVMFINSAGKKVFFTQARAAQSPSHNCH